MDRKDWIGGKLFKDYSHWYKGGNEGWSYISSEHPPLSYLLKNGHKYSLEEIKEFAYGENWADTEWKQEIIDYYIKRRNQELIKIWMED